MADTSVAATLLILKMRVKTDGEVRNLSRTPMAAEGPGTRVVGNLIVVGCIKKQTPEHVCFKQEVDLY